MLSFGRRPFRVAAICIPLLVLACVWTVELIAQTGREASRTRRPSSSSTEAWRQATRDSNLDRSESTEGEPDELTSPQRTAQRARTSSHNDDDEPIGLREPGLSIRDQEWQVYDLAPYTHRLPEVANPELDIVNWILRETGVDTWHGEDVAVISATRGKLRVFHRREIHTRVAETVERFTYPVQSQVSIRVQFVTTADVSWRDGLMHLMRPSAFGPEGQQVWFVAPEDAALIRSRLHLNRLDGPLSQHVTVQNGRETVVQSMRAVNYIVGVDLVSGTQLSYQPVIGRLHEGLKFSMRPLWTKDGNAVDIVIGLSTRSVLGLHRAQGSAPLNSGRQETTMQVPEALGTSFEQSFRWPTSQVLLISGGMQPTQSSSRRSTFGFASSTAELLILAEISAPFSSRSTARPDVPSRR